MSKKIKKLHVKVFLKKEFRANPKEKKNSGGQMPTSGRFASAKYQYNFFFL